MQAVHNRQQHPRARIWHHQPLGAAFLDKAQPQPRAHGPTVRPQAGFQPREYPYHTRQG